MPGVKSGAEGLEPPKWLDQNQLPYHLATPQRVNNVYNIMSKKACQMFYAAIRRRGKSRQERPKTACKKAREFAKNNHPAQGTDKGTIKR